MPKIGKVASSKFVESDSGTPRVPSVQTGPTVNNDPFNNRINGLKNFMCGIVGVWNTSERVDPSVFDSMVDSLSHRGPDGRGVKSLDEGRLLLGHRRLSVIDLTGAAAQPMPNEDGALWLTFNGEIYNYKDLRKQLEGIGHRFHSKSDSETVIHAYEQWGDKCVSHLRGIFSFAVYDTRNRRLFLARDHVGVKPLFFCHDPQRFMFASQPRAILTAADFPKNINMQAFSLYLAYGNTPADSCIYEGIRKLPPGHWLIYEAGNITVQRYWHLSYKPTIRDSNEAERAVNAKIREVVRAQTVSDVPVGTLLSGGVDSTIVTAILAQDNDALASFTIGFEEEESDERLYAGLAAKSLGTKHHERVLSYDNACRLLPEIIEAFDEPFHLNALFPYYAVSRLVQSEKIKVVLGGDGADELFAGYLWYERFLNALESRNSFANRVARAFGSKKNQRFSGPIEEYFHYNGFFDYYEQREYVGVPLTHVTPADIYEVLKRHWLPGGAPVLSAQLLDFNCFLVDHCLTKVDRASMACGVEVRVPFLDVDLVELVFSMDHSLVFKNKQRKYLLKRAMQAFLPEGMNTVRKKGFSSPIGIWLNRGLAKHGKGLLIDGSLCKYGAIDARKIDQYYDKIWHDKQLLLISAELWCRRWMDNDLESICQFSNKVGNHPLAEESPILN